METGVAQISAAIEAVAASLVMRVCMTSSWGFDCFDAPDVRLAWLREN